MPDTTIATPTAVVPEDRLTLGVTDARCCALLSHLISDFSCVMVCMAEE